MHTRNNATTIRLNTMTMVIPAVHNRVPVDIFALATTRGYHTSMRSLTHYAMRPSPRTHDSYVYKHTEDFESSHAGRDRYRPAVSTLQYRD